MTSQPPIYLIKRVTCWSSSDLGDEIQLETTIEDGSLVVLRSEYRDVPRLMLAIREGAAIAEQKQNLIPDSEIRMFSPWEATAVDTGLSPQGDLVGLHYQTTEGVPIELALSKELARETVERLSAELDNLDRGQRPRYSS